ncbi:alpha/beta-hydrolase [Mycena rosella]|uniref:Carboxypeptidase n=1 Tax=Mycena rosella TaxID=1033263 RepID=A0AAD7G828_MYCRO|nr:alpha/beta-hydrolase [Mycena rosella]
MLRNSLAFTSLLFLGCVAQSEVPSSFPHAYPGMPTTPFGPDWQKYFEVAGPLPNVTGPIARSFAGNVGVNRADHPNATLFFWAFEKANGTLTGAAADTDPWMIWLNGGPGSSSMIGLMTENGPLQVTGDYSIVQNNFSWNKLADTVWVDQPVGTGYSTSDATGYVPDEDQMGRDFVEFLSNIVKIFPSLAKRPLHLAGESYAGTYIPYITKTIFSTSNPPVNLTKMIVGDGTLGSEATFQVVPMLTVIETYPELISYDPDVFNYFKTQYHLCGYDLNLTYPQNGHFPTLRDPSFGSNTPFAAGARTLSLKALAAHNGRLSQLSGSVKRELAVRREEHLQAWKRDLAGRANGTIDPWYGCSIAGELLDYVSNFSFPWSGYQDLCSCHHSSLEQVYDIPDALNPEVPSDAAVFMNDKQTRAALHAPTSKDWVASFNFPFGSSSDSPMVFLSDLATNATARGVGIVFYSGNDDSLVAHRGTEVVIQNMTFGGVQGFTRKPATPFTDDKGNFAGIIHQERNLTYALFKGAGHLVPNSVPEAAFVFVREFVLGSNTTGLVNSNGTVVGGEDPTLALDVMPGSNVIYYGDGSSGKTTLSTVIPSATVASWQQFIETATATASGSGSTSSQPPCA